MKAVGRVLATTIMFVASPHVQAGIRPSFHLEHCAWHATDIVVASEGEAIDGKLSVLKVLAGALKIGDTISVPELDQFRAKESRTVHPHWRTSDNKEPPLVLTGDKLVLFLKRGGDKVATGPTWSPASPFGGMNGKIGVSPYELYNALLS
jgi:hypothetical protein